MSNLRTILEELVQDPELKKYPYSYNPIIIEKAEQRIKELMLGEGEIRSIFLKIGERKSVNDEDNKGHWRWAWIIDYDDLATAIHLAMLKKLG